MELTAAEGGLLHTYLAHFDPLAGDRRTRTVFHETVRGIIGAESLCCSRIAAFPPCADVVGKVIRCVGRRCGTRRGSVLGDWPIVVS